MLLVLAGCGGGGGKKPAESSEEPSSQTTSSQTSTTSEGTSAGTSEEGTSVESESSDDLNPTTYYFREAAWWNAPANGKLLIALDGEKDVNTMYDCGNPIGTIKYSDDVYVNDYSFDVSVDTIYFRDEAWWAADEAYTAIYAWNDQGALGDAFPGTMMTCTAGAPPLPRAATFGASPLPKSMGRPDSSSFASVPPCRIGARRASISRLPISLRPPIFMTSPGLKRLGATPASAELGRPTPKLDRLPNGPALRGVFFIPTW